MSDRTWTPAPWPESPPTDLLTGKCVTITVDDYNRARACVAKCEGFEDLSECEVVSAQNMRDVERDLSEFNRMGQEVASLRAQLAEANQGVIRGLQDFERYTVESERANRLEADLSQTKDRLNQATAIYVQAIKDRDAATGHLAHASGIIAAQANELDAARTNLADRERELAEVKERLHESEIDRICFAARCDHAEPDASRYLVLRNADINAVHKGGLFAGLTPDNIVINGDDLDKRCDEVIAQRGK